MSRLGRFIEPEEFYKKQIMMALKNAKQQAEYKESPEITEKLKKTTGIADRPVFTGEMPFGNDIVIRLGPKERAKLKKASEKGYNMKRWENIIYVLWKPQKIMDFIDRLTNRIAQSKNLPAEKERSIANKMTQLRADVATGRIDKGSLVEMAKKIYDSYYGKYFNELETSRDILGPVRDRAKAEEKERKREEKERKAEEKKREAEEKKRGRRPPPPADDEDEDDDDDDEFFDAREERPVDLDELRAEYEGLGFRRKRKMKMKGGKKRMNDKLYKLRSLLIHGNGTSPYRN